MNDNFIIENALACLKVNAKINGQWTVAGKDVDGKDVDGKLELFFDDQKEIFVIEIKRELPNFEL